MAQQTTEALRAWFRGVERIFPELWNAAYAMCGNDELADEALRGAILDVWAQEAVPGVGFREKLRGTLRRECQQLLATPDGARAEFNWPGVLGVGEEDALLQLALREPPEVQRLLMLCRGCGLSYRMAGQFTGQKPEQVRALLARFDGRCRRSMDKRERPMMEALLTRQTRRALCHAVPGMPRPERVYRDFEAEAMSMTANVPRLKRVLGQLTVFLMALLCALMFWIFSVISTPSAEAEVSRHPDVEISALAIR